MHGEFRFRLPYISTWPSLYSEMLVSGWDLDEIECYNCG